MYSRHCRFCTRGSRSEQANHTDWTGWAGVSRSDRSTEHRRSMLHVAYARIRVPYRSMFNLARGRVVWSIVVRSITARRSRFRIRARALSTALKCLSVVSLTRLPELFCVLWTSTTVNTEKSCNGRPPRAPQPLRQGADGTKIRGPRGAGPSACHVRVPESDS